MLFAGRVPIRDIGPQTAVLLFNVKTRLLNGVFAPVGQPGYIEPKAFGGEFPNQLRVAPIRTLRCITLDKLAAQRCCVDPYDPMRLATGLLGSRQVDHLMHVMLHHGQSFPPQGPLR